MLKVSKWVSKLLEETIQEALKVTGIGHSQWMKLLIVLCNLNIQDTLLSFQSISLAHQRQLHKKRIWARSKIKISMGLKERKEVLGQFNKTMKMGSISVKLLKLLGKMKCIQYLELSRQNSQMQFIMADIAN